MSGLNSVPESLDATDARVEIDGFAFQELVESARGDVFEETVAETLSTPDTVAEEVFAPSASPDDFTVTVTGSHEAAERPSFLPFLVQKESGPLDADLIVRFNTSELLLDTAFDLVRTETGSLPLPAQARMGTADLLESIASNIDSSFGVIEDQIVREEETEAVCEASVAEPVCEASVAEPVADSSVAVVEDSPLALLEEFDPEPLGVFEPEAGEPVAAAMAEVESPIELTRQIEDAGADLQQMFEEVSGNTGNLTPLLDYETHYSLGLAYKDMELFDEAIEQFQLAFKVAGAEEVGNNYIQCCHMLGVCFNRKQLPRVAVMWFERGLKVPGRTDDEYQALRYEIGLCLEEAGEVDRAIDVYMEVYGIDVNYRHVGEKIKRLQALKTA
jgi:hypothetical protein